MSIAHHQSSSPEAPEPARSRGIAIRSAIHALRCVISVTETQAERISAFLDDELNHGPKEPHDNA